MEPEGSLPHSKEHATCHIYAWVFQVVPSLRFSHHLSSPPYMLHAPPISFFSIWSPKYHFVRSKKSLSSSLWSFLHYPFTSSPLGPNILSSTLLSKTPSLDTHPCPGRIRTRNPSKLAALDPRVRPHSHRDRLTTSSPLLDDPTNRSIWCQHYTLSCWQCLQLNCMQKIMKPFIIVSLACHFSMFGPNIPWASCSQKPSIMFFIFITVWHKYSL